MRRRVKSGPGQAVTGEDVRAAKLRVIRRRAGTGKVTAGPFGMKDLWAERTLARAPAPVKAAVTLLNLFKNRRSPADADSCCLRCRPLPRLARAASSRASAAARDACGDPGVAVQARGQHRAVVEQVDLAGEQARIGGSGRGGQFPEKVTEPAAVGPGDLVGGAARLGLGGGPVEGAAVVAGTGEDRGLHAEDAQQALARIGVRLDGGPQPRLRDLHPVFQVRTDQFILAAERAVKRGPRDIGPLDDPVDADAVHPLGVKQLVGRLQQPLPG